MARGKRVCIGEGIYRDRYGIAAKVRVGSLSRERRFPHDTPRDDIKSWRDETRVQLRKANPKAQRWSLAADIDRYERMGPVSADRQRELAKWRDAFGDVARATLTASQISEQLEAWRRTEDWAPSTLNHHRTALQRLYSRLDGRSAANVVREVPRYREPDAAPRGLSWPVIRAILGAMPSSVTRLRVALIASTGLPHAILGSLRREDVDWDRRVYHHPGRHKGRGSKGQLLPMSRRAAWYFKLLDRMGGWGAFSRSSLHKSFRLGCEKAGERLQMDLSRVRPYDCRHSFAISVLQASGNLQAVSTLLSHQSVKTTMRYLRATVDRSASEAVNAVDGTLRGHSTALRRK